MAAPYSLDLRQKVLQACEREGRSQRVVAHFFGVSVSFVETLLRRVRRSGELVAPRRRPGRHRRIDTASCALLEQWLAEQPDLTLAELAERLKADSRIVASVPTLCRALQRLGLRRKKRHSTPRSATPRRYVRHVVSTGKTLPATPSRD